ncbi:glycine cleavage system aminomethyltransferase GcvT [Serinibacter arcticus]|uniref:aminomethyltransferase n=1 Tax=Serinibacter arcticus TaxID=1655435 RepID=A0A4Z1E5F2_9MICO|nr:glycine cleavage system aminomethyltransferase GcvT [Serinibacter arcticus]TGO06540.1 Aminomethyltransferase (glycine cleavage system T protein) [Serinibacter arcticus]
MTDPTVPSAPLLRTPLHDLHVAAGATMVPFAGWSMPVKYTSDVAEHVAVRTTAGLFDISHMGQLSVEGPDAAAFLDHALAGRMSALAPLQSKYTMMLAPSGGIVDDLIVTNTHTPEAAASRDPAAPTAYLVVANAGNRDAVLAALIERTTTAERTFDVVVTDTHRALIAVQGPRAQAILEGLAAAGRLTLDASSGATLADLRYYRSAPGAFDGETITLSRTGYTGEDGFEISVAPERAVELWEAISAVGAPHGLVLAGLASRDTLRLEAGMPLYGHELSLDTLPAQAGLGRVVVTAKDDFVGREAILAGPPADAPVLVGIALTGRRAGRADYPVVLPDGGDGALERVGTVTSGVLSPTLGHPIAMAYVAPHLAEIGTALAVDVRGTAVPGEVVALPFYRRAKES